MPNFRENKASTAYLFQTTCQPPPHRRPIRVEWDFILCLHLLRPPSWYHSVVLPSLWFPLSSSSSSSSSSLSSSSFISGTSSMSPTSKEEYFQCLGPRTSPEGDKLFLLIFLFLKFQRKRDPLPIIFLRGSRETSTDKITRYVEVHHKNEQYPLLFIYIYMQPSSLFHISHS